MVVMPEQFIRLSFAFRKGDRHHAEYSYTTTRVDEPIGVWYAPFDGRDETKDFAYGLLEAAGQTDASLETPEAPLQTMMMVYGEPYKVSVSPAGGTMRFA
jgi:hypothetical protein